MQIRRSTGNRLDQLRSSKPDVSPSGDSGKSGLIETNEGRRINPDAAARVSPLTTRLALALLFIGRNWHRLQRRWNQTQGHSQVMKPIEQIVSHNSPLRVSLHGVSILRCLIEIIALCLTLRILRDYDLGQV